MNATVASAPSAMPAAASQYLTFVLDGGEYGIPILQVQGIQGWQGATPVPNAPDFICGVINLRGEIVPVIDMRRRLQLAERPFTAHTVVIIVRDESGGRTAGLVVDAVADVQEIGSDVRQQLPEVTRNAATACISALGMANDKLVILLEPGRLLDWRQVTAPNPTSQ